MNTNTIVGDIRQGVLKICEGTGSKNRMVRDMRNFRLTLTLAQTQSRSATSTTERSRSNTCMQRTAVASLWLVSRRASNTCAASYTTGRAGSAETSPPEGRYPAVSVVPPYRVRVPIPPLRCESILPIPSLETETANTNSGKVSATNSERPRLNERRGFSFDREYKKMQNQPMKDDDQILRTELHEGGLEDTSVILATAGRMTTRSRGVT